MKSYLKMPSNLKTKNLSILYVLYQNEIIERHLGVYVCPVALDCPSKSNVYRNVWAYSILALCLVT